MGSSRGVRRGVVLEFTDTNARRHRLLPSRSSHISASTSEDAKSTLAREFCTSLLASLAIAAGFESRAHSANDREGGLPLGYEPVGERAGGARATDLAPCRPTRRGLRQTERFGVTCWAAPAARPLVRQRLLLLLLLLLLLGADCSVQSLVTLTFVPRYDIIKSSLSPLYVAETGSRDRSSNVSVRNRPTALDAQGAVCGSGYRF